MCGIIAVVRRRSDRAIPTTAELVQPLEGASEVLLGATPAQLADAIEVVADCGSRASTGCCEARPGIPASLGDRALPAPLDRAVPMLLAALADRRGGARRRSRRVPRLEARERRRHPPQGRDVGDRARPPAHRTSPVADLAGLRRRRCRRIEAFASVQAAALGARSPRGAWSRLGRLMFLVHGHGLDLDDPAIAALLAARADDPLFTSGAVRVTPEGHLSFVYKAAAEIGELGDNTAGPAQTPSAAMHLLHLRRRRRRGRGHGARPHPLGVASASSPSPTPTR